MTAGSGSPDDTPVGGRTDSGTPPKPAAQLAAAAKLEQIKDLYLTAEAIGEDALSKHFQQVSDRQRQLIKEYFDQAVKGATERRAP